METVYYTLFDFMTHTKGIGYIVAGILLVGFIPFWRFLTEREGHDRSGSTGSGMTGSGMTGSGMTGSGMTGAR
jgi:hypothetical protein